MKKGFLKGLIALFIATPFLFGCSNNQPILATGISLSETSKSITYDPDAQVKESFVLTATVTPSNYNHGTIEWSGGKSYDDVYVNLTPSADGKTCTVTANKVCTDGINVYAKIMGDKEYSASCEVKVLKKKIHATSIEFTDTTAKTLKMKESITVPYTVTPAINDDLVMAVCSNTTVISAVPDVQNKTIIISAKLPGTSTVTISCWDDQTKKCECTTSLSVTVQSPMALGFSVGGTIANKMSNLDTAANAFNVFSITPYSNITLTSTSPMALKITPRNQTAVDLAKFNCTVGLTKKGTTTEWLFVGLSSEATYTDSKEYVLEAGEHYYVIIKNNAELFDSQYDIRVTMPSDK